VKSFTVTAFFPEVKPAHNAWWTVTVTASDFTVAATRGLRKIRSYPGISGKHITEVRLTVKQSDTELNSGSGIQS
jgi:hypothetical protein